MKSVKKSLKTTDLNSAVSSLTRTRNLVPKFELVQILLASVFILVASAQNDAGPIDSSLTTNSAPAVAVIPQVQVEPVHSLHMNSVYSAKKQPRVVMSTLLDRFRLLTHAPQAPPES